MIMSGAQERSFRNRRNILVTEPHVIPSQSNLSSRNNDRNTGNSWGVWGKHIRTEQDRQKDMIEGIGKDLNKVNTGLSIKVAHLEARVAVLYWLIPISITVTLAIAGFIFNWISKK